MSESNALVERRQEFAAKQKQLAAVFEAAGPDMDFSRKSVLEMLGAVDSADAVAKVKSRNIELQNLGDELQRAAMLEVKSGLRERELAINTPASVERAHPAGEMKVKSFGDLVVDSKLFQGWNRKGESPSISVEMDLKTLMTTSAGFAPESPRTGLVVPIAGAKIRFLDIMPVRQINQAVDKYMAQTTLTNNSAEKAEAGTYAESVFVYTETTSPIRKITNSIPVTDEQLEDAPEVIPILNGDVTRGLRERLELQVLVGDGSSPNIAGFLDDSRSSVQTTAKGSNPVFDAVATALNLVRTTGDADPSHIVMHPTNWLAVRLMRTADGQYIMGNPAVAGPEALFGLPVVQTTRITSGTALVGDFLNFSYIASRRGVDVQVGYSSTQFVEGKRTIRADLRAGLTVTREAAFCTVTGL